MVVITQFTTVLVGLSTIASAVPMARPPPTNSPRRAFSVNQITRPLEKTKKVNLPGIYANALAKYGGEVPANIKDAASQGSAVATPEQYDLAYLTPVKVGKSTLNLDIDTGSADLWVFSDQLPQAEQTGHDVYTPTSNATKMNGYSWSIQYGDGSHASGDVYKDVVEIGGVIAPRQAVEAASKISDQFVNDRDNDGLLGLSFSSINTVKPQPQTTFFDSVKNDLDSPLFAATLKYHAPGSYDFGYIDKKKHKGSLAYTEVDNTKGFWMFTAGGYGIGDAPPNSNSISGIADTGTTLLLVPDTIVEEYYKSVDGAQNNQQAGGYTFPCKTKLPSFTVAIGEYNAVIPGQYINYAPVSEGGDLCFGGIQSNSGLPFSIFGDIFLKSQYVVFDSQGPRLGFAPQA